MGTTENYGLAGSLYPEASDMLKQYMPAPEKQRQQAFQQAALAAGLGILSSGGQPLAQSIAQGGLMGLQAYGQANQGGMDAAMQRFKQEEELTKMLRDRDAYAKQQAAQKKLAGLPQTNSIDEAIKQNMSLLNDPELGQRAMENLTKLMPFTKNKALTNLVNKATGKLEVAQEKEYGAPEFVPGVAPKPDIHMQDLKDRIVAQDYNQLRGGESLIPGMSPEQVAQNKIAQGNLAVAQGNLAVNRGELGLKQQQLELAKQNAQREMNSPGRPVETSQGIVFYNEKTGKATPSAELNGSNIPFFAPSQKPPEEFYKRMQAAKDYENASKDYINVLKKVDLNNLNNPLSKDYLMVANAYSRLFTASRQMDSTGMNITDIEKANVEAGNPKFGKILDPRGRDNIIELINENLRTLPQRRQSVQYSYGFGEDNQPLLNMNATMKVNAKKMLDSGVSSDDIKSFLIKNGYRPDPVFFDKAK